jgi:hypothetical protein
MVPLFPNFVQSRCVRRTKICPKESGYCIYEGAYDPTGKISLASWSAAMET